MGDAASTRAIVLHPDLATIVSRRSAASRLEEAVGLAAAIDLDIRFAEVVPLKLAKPATLFGSGKLEEIGKFVADEEIELVVVDGQLSPVQQRNLEKALKAKVLDRTALILEIFGERAQTSEGVLQVELAHLNYQRSRLVRSWTHLERQRGGLGFVGGPGETQIEADRRMIGDRITRIEKKLEKVVKMRGLHRQKRKKGPVPVIALVGYTNAGKSTLFNRLTTGGVLAKDMLFATLDPTMRQIELPNGQRAILSDTVGFVSDLPTQLVAAFRATLEEVLEADILVHVRDVSHADSDSQAADVNTVLAGLGVEEEKISGAVQVFNKMDCLDDETLGHWRNLAARDDRSVLASAAKGIGTEEVASILAAILSEGSLTLSVALPADHGAEIAWLHEHSDVHHVRAEDTQLTLDLTISLKDVGRFEKEFGLALPVEKT